MTCRSDHDMTFNRPSSGLCVGVMDGNRDPITDNVPTYGNYQMYDLQENRVLIQSDKIFLEGDYLQMFAGINTIHYALSHGFRYVYFTKAKILKNISEQNFTRGAVLNNYHEVGYKRLEKALEYIKVLQYNELLAVYMYADSTSKRVCVRKWQKEFGEFPMQY